MCCGEPLGAHKDRGGEGLSSWRCLSERRQQPSSERNPGTSACSMAPGGDRTHAISSPNPKHLTTFAPLHRCRAMTNFNNLCPIEAVFLEYDFRPFSRFVDVGGGLGAFAAAALAAAPQLKGHLFDLPNVVKQAQQVRWGFWACRAQGDERRNMCAG